MDRVDILGRRPERWRAFGGRVLSDRLDEELQRVVAEASHRLNVPTALVTLVLDRLQTFRAHHGLPATLAAAGGTHRDASFCQFVVESRASFAVKDASADRRVPQELVREYGLSSYLGVPLELDDVVVGALCVIDTEVREYGPDGLEVMRELARAAVARLEELARQPADRSDALVPMSVAPSFAEIRNLLVPISAGAEYLAVANAELRASARAAGAASPGPGVSDETKTHLETLDEVQSVVADMASASQAIDRCLSNMQSVLERTPGGVHLDDVVAMAEGLAFHHTKLVGGVHWEGDLPPVDLAVPRSIAAASLSTALSLLSRPAGDARGPSSGVLAAARLDPESVVITLRSPPLDEAVLHATRDRIGVLLADELSVSVSVEGDALEIRFRRREA